MQLMPLSGDYIIFDKANFQLFLGHFVDQIPPNSNGHKLRLMLGADEIAQHYTEQYNLETLTYMKRKLPK